jgi:DNA (cytosine-5)-methyltransferase 1
MKDVWIKKIGENKGRPRIYLDGLQAVRAGFAPGERFEVIVDEDGRRVILQKNRDGTRRVSMKERGGKQYPVIDINSSELLGLFEGMDVVRLVVGTDSVYILPLASEVKKKERLARLTTKLRAAAGGRQPRAWRRDPRPCRASGPAGCRRRLPSRVRQRDPRGPPGPRC